MQQRTGTTFVAKEAIPVSGGCINASYELRGKGDWYFVKIHTSDRIRAFEDEARGLRELRAANVIRVPAPVCCGTADGHAFLVLEYLEFGDGDSGERLGRSIASLHRIHATRYGWEHDRRGGAPTDDWISFWRTARLGAQLERARDNGHVGRVQDLGQAVMDRLPVLFAGHHPASSLLHGDLWSGNVATLRDGQPVIFDPAVYYGDRETDLAFTELFGGFGKSFYRAYSESYPLDAGYATRKDVYNLFHILNHLNLFGGGYLAQAERTMKSILQRWPD